MVVSDPAAGKVVATAQIGGGTDGVAFDDGYAFSANGADGTITMVGELARASLNQLRRFRPSAARARLGPIRKATNSTCRPPNTDPPAKPKMARRGGRRRCRIRFRSSWWAAEARLFTEALF